MAKTQKELNTMKEEVETLSRKLAELTDEELEQVTGGVMPVIFVSVVRDVIRPGVGHNFDNNSWKTDALPTEPGNYKIGTDVELNENWTPNPGKTTIDR